jgi:protein-disulfide isomerase
MSNLLSVIRRISTVFMLFAVLTTGAIAEAAPIPAHPAIEADVLQVIKAHPKVILDTLIAYQQRLDQASATAKTEVLSNYQKNPSTLIKNSPTLGHSTSGRYIVEFSDFQCPYCQAAHETLKQLQQQNPDVTIVYKHFPLVQIHDQAMPAAQAAWAASKQGRFWEYHDRLFAQQDNLSDATYEAIAQDLHLNLAQFNRDRVAPAAIAAIQEDRKIADRLDIQGTPLFVVIGKQSATIVAGGNIDALQSALARV